MANDNDLCSDTVELPPTDGVAFVGLGSPLTRLHYFDGQFLRASALTVEQDYHRQAVRLANLAGGWGVVHGLGIALVADQIEVSEGLAVTAAGTFVLAPQPLQAKLVDLLKVAAPPMKKGTGKFADCLEPPKAGIKLSAALGIYEITVGPIEGLCGNEPVYGKLCETACATDSRHPWWREGVVLRLRPVTLALPASSAIAAGNVHLRNRIASAYFAAEPWLAQSLLSATGLASDIWCRPAELYGRDEVVIGLLAREGATVRVLDAWGGRRERMDTQARGYWQGRMAMRPWNVFVAQILQFQCQLAGLFDPDRPVILPGDDCEDLRELLGKTRKQIEDLLKRYGGSTQKLLKKIDGRPTIKEYEDVASGIKASFADLDGLSTQLANYVPGTGALPQQRMLLNAGFFELPPAGYLPVSLNADVQEQVRRMFGEGVRLQFHAVAADEIGHLVEQAQHMKRISLTRGLDDPKQLEPVEVFLPDGEVTAGPGLSPGTWWRLRMLGSALMGLQLLMSDEDGSTEPAPAPPSGTPAKKTVKKNIVTGNASVPTELTGAYAGLFNVELDGLLRSEGREDGSSGFAMAAATDALQPDALNRYENAVLTNYVADRLGMRLYVAADVTRDPFTLPVGGTTKLAVEVRMTLASAGSVATLDATLTVLAQRALSSGMQERLVQADLRMTNSGGASRGEDTPKRIRLLLRRDGDARSGVFVVDDERQDPATSPIFFDWDAAPQRAVMYIENATGDAEIGIKRSMQRLGLLQAGDLPQKKVDFEGAQRQRQQLMELSALPSMPEPDSALGTTTVNTLSALADATDDAGFLVRARRRLFPVLDAAPAQRVRARHDWLMFRRARTALCGPACTTAPSTATETFQVWHLRLKTMEPLPLLAKALDQGDAAALAKFRFERVGLLRYHDESAFPVETADHVLAMWQARNPDKQVALGRSWEIAPEAGQGWQNHMRLRNMLEQIASLTKPPARGAGVIGTIAPPPGLLGDSAYDGGLLVVTGPLQEQPAEPVEPDAPEVAIVHRVLMLPNDMYDRVVETSKANVTDGLRLLEDLVSRFPDKMVVTDLVFEDGTLSADEVTKLQQADQRMIGRVFLRSQRRAAFRLDASALPAGVDAPRQHRQVIDALGTALIDHGSATLPTLDLGGGASVATMLRYALG